MRILLKMLAWSLVSFLAYGLLLFALAGTFNYWQAWVYLIVVAISGAAPNIYLLRKNPTALQRRMPAAETRTVQKLIAAGVMLMSISTLAVSALDHRFGWSAVPPVISLVGVVLVAIGIVAVGLVTIQNSHAAVTVRVESGQRLVSTGLYGLVRHPMYTCNVFLLVGTPLALGSYWGLIFVVPSFLAFAFRIRDEERLLQEELDGYSEYMQKVRYRVAPYIW